MGNCGSNVDRYSDADGISLGDGDEAMWALAAMTLGSHQTAIGNSQTWITPRWILDTLGQFDLDPCAADPRPWNCADTNWTTDGLGAEWFGRVWLNPPFHRYEVGKWISRLAEYGCGTALIHARTEAEWFEPIWKSARAILFLSDRLYFHYPDGKRADANSGAPVCLAAFGEFDADALKKSIIAGYLVHGWSEHNCCLKTVNG